MTDKGSPDGIVRKVIRLPQPNLRKIGVLKQSDLLYSANLWFAYEDYHDITLFHHIRSTYKVLQSLVLTTKYYTPY